MKVVNSVIARGMRFAARLEDAEVPGRPLVVGIELAPARARRQALLRELELVRDARGALGWAGLLGEHRRGEELAHGRGAVLAVERDVGEQQMRVDFDLGVRVLDRRRRRASG